MIEVSQQYVAIAVPGMDTPHILTAGLERTLGGDKAGRAKQA